MAKFELTADSLTALLSVGEKIAAIHGNVEVARSRVTSARIVPKNFWWGLGLRVPGTGLAPFIVSGTYLKKGDKAFVSYFKGQTPVEITLTGAQFTRLIIGLDDLAAANLIVETLSPA